MRAKKPDYVQPIMTLEIYILIAQNAKTTVGMMKIIVIIKKFEVVSFTKKKG